MADLAHRMRTELQAGVSERLAISSLAAKLGTNRFRAYRAFKRRYGLAPQAFLLELRLSLARRALIQGLSPAAVASEFGFTDQSHLSRQFKRRFGLSPGRYAKRARKHRPKPRSI